MNIETARNALEEGHTIVNNQKWNVDDVLAYLADHCPYVEIDNDGQIVLYTDLMEDEEGNLVPFKLAEDEDDER